MELLTAFVIGLFGSLHCIGMCGPITLALPGSPSKSRSFISGRILYNFGRIITYSFIGLVFGLLGNRVALFGFQQVVSVILGVLVILAVVLPSNVKKKISAILGFDIYLIKLKSYFSKYFKSKNKSSLFIIGLLNGFLPCGFVYIGVTGAIAVSADTFYNGGLFMLLFGLGTLPVMLTTSLLGNLINLNVRKRLTTAIPVFVLILGIIFILRGLNLGIPYLSPKNPVKMQQSEAICH
ncbi:MAG: sulfite exporter TauE/SafE family protein [Ignavibacteriae bacterium]|nr:MAG: sulfite exporter TauE/SafE family protein [Ignavibacteriota bacterium]